jgi:uncharacterized protein YrrD
MKEMRGHRLGARDGDLGRVKDAYFDDLTWTVRYLVADTNTWLSGRKVLISPFAVRLLPSTPHGLIEVDLTKEQIEKSPPIEEHLPVSRQFELKYYNHYRWPYYWQGPELWGPAAFPILGYSGPPQVRLPESRPVSASEPPADPHLRSVAEVAGYAIHARDEAIGHVEDFIFDDETWMIRYLVVDTRNWWPGKRVLVAPEWVTSVDWHQSSVQVDLSRDTIQAAPEYHPTDPITREYEGRLYTHYGHEPYWLRQIAA